MPEPKRLDEASRLDAIMIAVGIVGLGLLVLGRKLSR